MTLVLLRVSPTLVTYTAGSSCTGQTFSHAPHPTQRLGSTCGRCRCTVLYAGGAPSGPGLLSRTEASTSSTQIAFGDVGQNSSQTMHGVCIAHGRHRPWS